MILRPTMLDTIGEAKNCLAPGRDPKDWANATNPSSIDVGTKSVAINGRLFHDNVARLPCSTFDDGLFGDTLPNVPTILTGCCNDWPAFASPGQTWSVADFAERTSNLLSLDGGPGFARMSLGSGKVSMREYRRYCNDDADGDSAPLYVFDPDILTSTFTNGRSVSEEYSIPSCFSKDVMACCSGTNYRPLPPAWLLVGAARSGTPIHDHPLTVAWNSLLVGCKLWCCLPPDVDESCLQFNLGGESGDDIEEEFDLSAIQWFEQCGELPGSALIIVQVPGEVVFVPAGWFHVVLNVETSTAISSSLTLRRDLPLVFPSLVESDKDFATFWLDQLETNVKFATSVGVSLEDVSRLRNTL